ncbi:MAG: MBL fold metallo-hydrolase [Ktedonobacterales bacterium]|nr:MBL fold metallo-hydrolase [Ktedonobacterales bacterium]
MDGAWFTSQRIGPGVWALQELIGRVAPSFDVITVNLYLVAGRERAAIIDAGMGIGDLAATCRALTPLPLISLSTHSHWDHIGGAYQFADRRIHPLEADRLGEAYDVEGVTHIRAAPPTATLEEGEVIDLGGRSLVVWHTPGHSPGHVSLLDAATGWLFCADVCYAGTMWMQTADADLTLWRRSLERIAGADISALYGGHEATPQSPELARRVLAGLDQALAGHSVSEPFPGDQLARKHPFDGFSILLRADATAGA